MWIDISTLGFVFARLRLPTLWCIAVYLEFMRASLDFHDRKLA